MSQQEKMVWVSLETALIHKSKRLVEPQSTEWQNNSWTGSPCCRYVHGNSLFTYPAVTGNIWATSLWEVCDSSQMFVQGLVLAFVAGFFGRLVKKIQPNNNNKKLQTTPRHQSSWRCPAKPTLPPQGCWDPIHHPDTGSTRWLPGSARTLAEMCDTNRPHFWLHSIQETSWDDSCNFHIPTFLPPSSQPL